MEPALKHHKSIPDPNANHNPNTNSLFRDLFLLMAIFTFP